MYGAKVPSLSEAFSRKPAEQRVDPAEILDHAQPIAEMLALGATMGVVSEAEIQSLAALPSDTLPRTALVHHLVGRALAALQARLSANLLSQPALQVGEQGTHWADFDTPLELHFGADTGYGYDSRVRLRLLREVDVDRIALASPQSFHPALRPLYLSLVEVLSSGASAMVEREILYQTVNYELVEELDTLTSDQLGQFSQALSGPVSALSALIKELGITETMVYQAEMFVEVHGDSEEENDEYLRSDEALQIVLENLPFAYLIEVLLHYRSSQNTLDDADCGDTQGSQVLLANIMALTGPWPRQDQRLLYDMIATLNWVIDEVTANPDGKNGVSYDNDASLVQGLVIVTSSDDAVYDGIHQLHDHLMQSGEICAVTLEPQHLEPMLCAVTNLAQYHHAIERLAMAWPQ